MTRFIPLLVVPKGSMTVGFRSLGLRVVKKSNCWVGFVSPGEVRGIFLLPA